MRLMPMRRLYAELRHLDAELPVKDTNVPSPEDARPLTIDVVRLAKGVLPLDVRLPPPRPHGPKPNSMRS